MTIPILEKTGQLGETFKLMAVNEKAGYYQTEVFLSEGGRGYDILGYALQIF